MLKQVSIFVENKPAMAYSVMETLAKAEINARAITIADTSEFGIIRLIVDDADGAKEILRKNGFKVKLTDVIGFAVPDRSGALRDVMRTLGEKSVNIRYSYSLMGNSQGTADIVIRVDESDFDKAVKILKDENVKLITINDIMC